MSRHSATDRKQWPTLTQVKRARKATLEKFFHDHNMYRKPLMEKRFEAIKSAQPLTSDDAVISPFRLQTLTLVDQLVVSLNALKMYDVAPTRRQFTRY